MNYTVFDTRNCILGEGPLWHPSRKQLFWFDIIGKKLLTQYGEAGVKEWSFDEHVSAAGWIDDNCLLIASQTGLWQFDVRTSERLHVVDIEADHPMTRSNDGRADPWGGFWIGTMGIETQPYAGSIYRYFKGELRKIVDKVTVSNSISFSPDRVFAYFSDTWSRQIMKVRLADQDGWPQASPEVFVDLKSEELNPDGSVVDSAGCLWNAQWGAGRVAQYGPDGRFITAYNLPASQVTCPAFGGPDLTTVFVTSASEGLGGVLDGQVFQFGAGIGGQAEHRVIL